MTATSRTHPDRLADYRARILAVLETSETWIMASTAGKKAAMSNTNSQRILDEMVVAGTAVAREGKKGRQYALAGRAASMSETWTIVRDEQMAAARINRAEVVAMALERLGRWATVSDVEQIAHMSAPRARQALEDLATRRKAAAIDTRMGTRKDGSPVEVRMYATIDVAARTDPAGTVAAKLGRRGTLEEQWSPREVVTMKPKAFTSPKLTKRENELTGPQMERLKMLAARMREGDAMTTADLGECMLVGGWVRNIETAPLAAVDMAAKLVDEAARIQRERAGL